MTSYVQRKQRMYMERPEWLRPERRRSDSRMKTYDSSTDIRNWCDVVEDRRQHILELMTRDIDKPLGKLIPMNVIIDMLLAMANADIAKLKNCLQQLWGFILDLDLPEEDKKKLQEITSRMDAICMEYDDAVDAESSPMAGMRRGLLEGLSDGSIRRPYEKRRFHGPGKMITRIKGLKPGFEVVDDPSLKTHIKIRSKRSGAEFNSDSSNELSKASKGVLAFGSSSEANLGSDKVAALQALNREQNDKIAELSKERNDLKKKLDACLKELDSFKKLQTIANPSLPLSCQQEIEALEAEIRIMRSGNPSPEEEAEIIKKEVEILKRYCSKLKDVESENERLKGELGDKAFKVQFREEGDVVQQVAPASLETLKDKLKNLEDLTKDRDELAERVQMLEKRLKQYEHLPDDVDELQSRSQMLDDVIKERDNMSKKIKMMKQMEEDMQKLKIKADKVDDLERELKNMSKGDRNSGLELRKIQSRASNLEIECKNLRCERDAMRKRVESMKKGTDNQKYKETEVEMLRLERDRLQIKLNEMADVQAQYEDMMNKMNSFDTIKAERDIYKQKYEEVLDMECKCQMLKAQVDEARMVSRERDHLQRQVQDLEACICEQEEEIKNLVLQVDGLSRSSNENAKEAARSQNMSSRMKELENLLHKAEHKNIQKDCHIQCLERELQSRAGAINLNKQMNRNEMELVENMKKELEQAKAENRRLQTISNKMGVVQGEDHMRKLLKQSECAVKNIAKELEKQYKSKDPEKNRDKRATSKGDCMCSGEASSEDDCEKLHVALQSLIDEKHKLERTISQLQEDSDCDCSLDSELLC